MWKDLDKSYVEEAWKNSKRKIDFIHALRKKKKAEIKKGLFINSPFFLYLNVV